MQVIKLKQMKKSFILILSVFLIFPVLSQSNQDFEFLKNAISVGCLKNGNVLTNSDKSRYVYRAITNTSKREVDFYPDMTYKFRDGSKSGKWECPQLSGNSFNSLSGTSNNSSSKTHKCNWCGRDIQGNGFSISGGEIRIGKYYDPFMAKMMGATDNVGDFCSRKCAFDFQ